MMDLSYEIVRSPKRKRLTITVERNRAVIVRAPQATSDEEVQRIVREKRQWILAKVRHPQKYQKRKHPPGKEVVNGESVPYLGRDYRIEIADTTSGEVEFARLFRIPAAHCAKRRDVLRNWYVARANEKILPRVAEYARKLGTDSVGAKIVDNRFRWGSCTPSNRLTINWRLIKAPSHVIDYVIVHELAHLLETNHTARFWSIVRTHAPLAEKAKAWLKQYGQVLEEDL
jgi:predicted metal-dependent hydrolase